MTDAPATIEPEAEACDEIEKHVFDPAEAQLTFATNRNTKRVHVLVPLQPGDEVITEGISYGDLASWFRTRTLCGRVLSWSDMAFIEAFDDERICMACHKKMGEHSDRLFEHAQG